MSSSTFFGFQPSAWMHLRNTICIVTWLLPKLRTTTGWLVVETVAFLHLFCSTYFSRSDGLCIESVHKKKEKQPPSPPFPHDFSRAKIQQSALNLISMTLNWALKKGRWHSMKSWLDRNRDPCIEYSGIVKKSPYIYLGSFPSPKKKTC